MLVEHILFHSSGVRRLAETRLGYLLRLCVQLLVGAIRVNGDRLLPSCDATMLSSILWNILGEVEVLVS